MTNQFTLNFNWEIFIAIFFIVILTFIVKKLYKSNLSKTIRVTSSFTILTASILIANTIYLNTSIYQSIENFELINKWSQTQTYISKGFVYPFIHSFSYAFDQEPMNYSDSLAIEILDEFENDNIPKGKKVDIVAVMLEAYNDFSKFEQLNFLIDVYKPLHSIEEVSFSGELVNNIFAGETVDTEWGFLTGYTKYHDIRSMTNSYIHYFSNQGYHIEGSHPCYKWFYNRENVNKYLGFNNYYFFENHYSAIANNTIAKDKILFPEIIKLHEKAKSNDKPYFSFNVTYQNHGPYIDSHTSEISFIDEGNLSDKSFNILNNYLAGIYDTNKELLKFVNYYRNKEATVIILFGDHNPWLGDNNKVYNELGINLDLEANDGFYNYYNTPYLIWANDKAKEALSHSFIGQGATIGPYFLMNTFFELANYQGNSFMKLSNLLKEKTPLVHRDGFYIVNNELTRDLDSKSKDLLDKFNIAQYYYRNNFNN